jgi:pimeloyl-ACP methyl ester carboxylesterase
VTDSDYVEMGKRIRPEPQFEALPVDFRELGPSYRAANPEGTARWLVLSRSQSHVAGVPPSTLPADRYTLKPERKVTWAKLEALRVPTLLIIGLRDRTAVGAAWAPKEVAERMGDYTRLGKRTAALIPNERLVELPGVGHLPQVEAFEQYRDALLSFLK